jgi:hypothetical protein
VEFLELNWRKQKKELVVYVINMELGKKNLAKICGGTEKKKKKTQNTKIQELDDGVLEQLCNEFTLYLLQVRVQAGRPD